MSTGQNLSFSRLASAGASGSAVIALGLLADDDRGRHGAVGVLGAVIEAGLVESVADFGLVEQVDQMLRRELRRRKVDALRLRLFDLDLDALAVLGGGAPGLLVEVLVDEGLGDEGEGLALGILERRRLLVGEPRRIAGVDPGHEAEGHGVALAGRTVELIHHAAGDAGDPRTGPRPCRAPDRRRRDVAQATARRRPAAKRKRSNRQQQEMQSALRASRNSGGGGHDRPPL